MGPVAAFAILFLVGMLTFQGFRLLTWLVGLIFPAQAVATAEGGASLATQPLGVWTRFGDWLLSLLWPFKPARVPLAFPCPACFQPLSGKVAPGEDLACPWCRTTFQTPEPPLAAPPVPKVVLKREKTRGFFWGIFRVISLICGFGYVMLLFGMAMFVDMPREAMVLWMVLLGSLLGAWILQALFRRFWRKETFLPNSFFGVGGGTALVQEVMRVLFTVGLPIAVLLVFSLVGGCLSGIAGVFLGIR